MKLQKTIVAELNEEEIRQAIAEYASVAFAGEYVFDPARVIFRMDEEPDGSLVEVSASITAKQ